MASYDLGDFYCASSFQFESNSILFPYFHFYEELWEYKDVYIHAFYMNVSLNLHFWK